LFREANDLEELRKALMDLAVSGLLSEPTIGDETAQELKNQILAAKERGISEGRLSRKRHVKPESLEEGTLPTRWQSITLDDAISSIDAGWSPACLPNARTDETKWGVLKTTAVQVLRFLPEEHKELPAALDPRPQYQIGLRDILVTRAGPKNRVGICCVVDHAPPRLMISDKLIRFHIVDDLIDPNFVVLCLSAGEPGRVLERLKSGMADSQMNISQDKLRSITIPLPPIAEQRRILKTLDGLMKTADRYAEQLVKFGRLGQHFSAAAIASMTGISIEQEAEAAVKAPQTELIAPLRLGSVPDVKAQAPLATILARHDGELAARDLWQRFGGDIDAFYAQLKTEVQHGWIAEPALAEVRERSTESTGA
jgi:type I restriction enzyme, S subunit